MLDSEIYPSGPNISKILPFYKNTDITTLDNYYFRDF